jgi:ankyrin repeat protein
MTSSNESIRELTGSIERGDVHAVAQALRSAPSLVDARTSDGDTALHIACWQKQISIVGLVLGYHPDVNARGAYGRTPLHYAVHEGRAISAPIVGMLLAAGADPNIRDQLGYSVEDWAKIEMDDGLAEVLDMLRRARGERPNAADPPTGEPGD